MSTALIQPKNRKRNKTIRRNRLLRELPLYALVAPAMVLVAVYSYGAMVGIIFAFQKFAPANGLFGSKWIGFENFRTLFNYPNIWNIIRNTVFISTLKMIGGIIVPVSFALLLNEIVKLGLKRTIQTMVYLPNFLSWVILAGIFRDILSPSSGIVNKLISAVGLQPVFFLGNISWFPITMVVTEIWKGFGFGSIIYLAALTSVDPTLYEAASIDGANRWRQTLHITLPGIYSTIILMTVLSLGSILNGGFDQIYNLYSPAVYSTGDILDTFVYRLGIVETKYALSTAAGLFKSVVSLGFILISYTLADRIAGYRIF
jgi:putative aldouronate transport system permease protein